MHLIDIFDAFLIYTSLRACAYYNNLKELTLAQEKLIQDVSLCICDQHLRFIEACPSFSVSGITRVLFTILIFRNTN